LSNGKGSRSFIIGGAPAAEADAGHVVGGRRRPFRTVAARDLQWLGGPTTGGAWVPGNHNKEEDNGCKEGREESREESREETGKEGWEARWNKQRRSQKEVTVKLKDARDNYYFYSGKTSDILRQMALAGVALAWIFKHDVNGTPVIPAGLLAPTFLVVLTLVFDFAQYISGTIAWGTYNRYKEKKVGEEAEFLAPAMINWPALAFFVLKAGALVIAYVLLLGFLRGQVSFTAQ
jgi:hypothetical protein